VLDHALRREHVLDLARADPERERAEGAVGGGVRVAADDRHARLGDAQLGADHVHDPLAVRAERVDRDAELGAVALERLHLHARELVLDPRRHGRAVGGRVVVGGRERAVGPAHRAAGQAQPVERLRAGHLVDEVQVDVEQAGRHLVGLPDLVEQRLGIVPSQLRLSSCGDDRQEGGVRVALFGVLEVVGQVGVEGHAVALGSSWRSVAHEHHRAALDERRLAAAGLVHRRIVIGARSRRPARACGARARRAGRAVRRSAPRSCGRAACCLRAGARRRARS
jgi:hypothetical protein